MMAQRGRARGVVDRPKDQESVNGALSDCVRLELQDAEGAVRAVDCCEAQNRSAANALNDRPT